MDPPNFTTKQETLAAALQRPPDPVASPYLILIEPTKPIIRKQRDPEVAPYFVKRSENNEETVDKREFVLHKGVLCRMW